MGYGWKSLWRTLFVNPQKITINLGFVDLGHIDLMVQEGFYSNRTDFIRTAIRNQVERHADVAKQSAARRGLDLGLRNFSREDLEAARGAGEMLHINVLGLASIAQDVTSELRQRVGGFACQSSRQGCASRQDTMTANRNSTETDRFSRTAQYF